MDDVARTITIRRGPILAGTALPRSIVPEGVVPSKELAESLLRTGRQVAELGIDGDGVPASVRALLLRTPPRRRAGAGRTRAPRRARRPSTPRPG